LIGNAPDFDYSIRNPLWVQSKNAARRKINKHKRRKKLRLNRHKKRTWQQ